MQWGKQSYLATLRVDTREAHAIRAYCFTGTLFSSVNSPIDKGCLNVRYLTAISYNFGSFYQTETISHAHQNIILTIVSRGDYVLTDADITLFI